MTHSVRSLVLALSVIVAAPAQSENQPATVAVESRVSNTGSGQAVVTNRAAVPLTAYLLEVHLEPCNPLQPASSWRVADAIADPAGVSLGPSASRTDDLGISHCNKDGVSMPARGELKAAIFQDGSTWGDVTAVALLLDHRRLVLAECDAILEGLHAAAPASPAAAVLDDVRARAVRIQKASLLPFSAVPDPLEAAQRQLGGPSATPLTPDQLTRAVGFFEAWRKRILEARPAVR